MSHQTTHTERLPLAGHGDLVGMALCVYQKKLSVRLDEDRYVLTYDWRAKLFWHLGGDSNTHAHCCMHETSSESDTQA